MLRDPRRGRRPAVPAGAPGGQATATLAPRPPRVPTLPFDYAVTLRLDGVPGRIAQGTITTGPDAVFVATGIGYGFAEDATRPIESPEIAVLAGAAAPPPDFIPRDLTLAQLPPRALVDGFRINPRARLLMFELDPDVRVIQEPESLIYRADRYQWARRGELFQRVQTSGELSFLLSVVDSATGRELQDEPIHNLASLGRADGRRPFRALARPVAFLPRSTIRVQVIERQADRTGRLDLVLFGYKVLAGSGASEAAVRAAIAREAGQRPHWGRRVIPFDYVAQIPLTGTPGDEHETELAINVEGSFVATTLSYALDTPEQRVPIFIDPIRPPPPAPAIDIRNPDGTFRLSDVTLERLPPDALLDGIRLRPEYVRLAFDNGGRLAASVRPETADALFERLNRADTVAFRYRLFDGGAGRDLQNQPILSIAGLGSADGSRPFRQFSRPLLFEPRSTFRVVVQEIRGRGTLHLVLQGYKRLTGGTP